MDSYSLPDAAAALSRSTAWPPRTHMRRVRARHTLPTFAAIISSQKWSYSMTGVCSSKQPCKYCNVAAFPLLSIHKSKFKDRLCWQSADGPQLMCFWLSDWLALYRPYRQDWKRNCRNGKKPCVTSRFLVSCSQVKTVMLHFYALISYSSCLQIKQLFTKHREACLGLV